MSGDASDVVLLPFEYAVEYLDAPNAAEIILATLMETMYLVRCYWTLDKVVIVASMIR